MTDEMADKMERDMTDFLFPTFTRVAGLSGALPFVRVNLRSCHDDCENRSHPPSDEETQEPQE
jgi:hypothetical protein